MRASWQMGDRMPVREPGFESADNLLCCKGQGRLSLSRSLGLLYLDPRLKTLCVGQPALDPLMFDYLAFGNNELSGVPLLRGVIGIGPQWVPCP
jgi:hypothetical protein